jgi:sugar/nucleoside kinase (ribokinase family)
VGDDLFGRFLLDELAAAGITDGVSSVPGTPTGVSIALEAPQRDRSFLTLLGTLEVFDEASIPAAALTRDFVLLCGYFCLPALRGRPTRRLLERIRSAGGISLFDSGWDPKDWPTATRREVQSLLPLIDVFLPNESEAAAITGLSDPRAAARALQRATNGWIVVKRGREGCLACGPEGVEYEVPAPQVEVVDTTGAGDGLNAGLLYALSRGESWADAVHFGTVLASSIVSRPSCSRYPSIADPRQCVSEGYISAS